MHQLDPRQQLVTQPHVVSDLCPRDQREARITFTDVLVSGKCTHRLSSSPSSEGGTPRDSPLHTTLSFEGTYSVSKIVAATFTARIEKPLLARRYSSDRAQLRNTQANDDLLSPSTENTQLRHPIVFDRSKSRRIARYSYVFW